MRPISGQIAGNFWEDRLQMGAESQATPLAGRIEAELERLVTAGLWDIGADQIEQLRSLSIFGGAANEPVPLNIFRPAFRDFLKANEELAGALAEMTLRLYGAEQPWREGGQDGRLQAFGEVVWRGKTNVLETTRRPGGKRRREVRELLTKAILTAEAGQDAENSLLADVSGAAPSDDSADTQRHAPQAPRALQEPSPHQSRRFRFSRRPPALAAFGLVVAIVVAGLAIGLWVEGSTGPQATRHSGQANGQQAAPEPLVNRDASCASLGADAREHTPSTEFVDSPGQLGGGGRGLMGRTTPNGKYGTLLEVTRGDIVRVRITLHDTESSSVSDVVVAVAVAPERPRCTRLMAVARSTSSPRDRAELGPLTLKSTSDSPPRLKYIPGSTSLLTESGHQIAHLSDGVIDMGTAIPYQIPPGSTDYFVNFAIKVE